MKNKYKKSCELANIFYSRVIFISFLVFVVFIFIFPCNYENLLIFLAFIVFGNFLISHLAQFLHYKNELEFPYVSFDKNGNYSGNLYKNKQSCFVRCLSGIFEMIFYAFFFVIGLWEIIAGYLVMKSLSLWDPKRNEKKECKDLNEYKDNDEATGMSLAVLRIAIVLSLIIALLASHFLGLYLKDINFKPASFFPFAGF